MKNEWRRYRCRNCGRLQDIATNHLGPVIDYCGRGSTVDDAGCSWKPSYGVGRAIPFGGRTYRDFDYAGDDSNNRLTQGHA